MGSAQSCVRFKQEQTTSEANSSLGTLAKLPREVRDDIYSAYFGKDRCVEQKKTFTRDPIRQTSEYHYPFHKLYPSEILCVSKQVRQEAKLIEERPGICLKLRSAQFLAPRALRELTTEIKMLEDCSSWRTRDRWAVRPRDWVICSIHEYPVLKSLRVGWHFDFDDAFSSMQPELLQQCHAPFWVDEEMIRDLQRESRSGGEPGFPATS